MILTEEMIANLPVITEEEEKDYYWTEEEIDEFIRRDLERFQKAFAEIDKLYESRH